MVSLILSFTISYISNKKLDIESALLAFINGLLMYVMAVGLNTLSTANFKYNDNFKTQSIRNTNELAINEASFISDFKLYPWFISKEISYQVDSLLMSNYKVKNQLIVIHKENSILKEIINRVLTEIDIDTNKLFDPQSSCIDENRLLKTIINDALQYKSSKIKNQNFDSNSSNIEDSDLKVKYEELLKNGNGDSLSLIEENYLIEKENILLKEIIEKAILINKSKIVVNEDINQSLSNDISDLSVKTETKNNNTKYRGLPDVGSEDDSIYDSCDKLVSKYKNLNSDLIRHLDTIDYLRASLSLYNKKNDRIIDSLQDQINQRDTTINYLTNKINTEYDDCLICKTVLDTLCTRDLYLYNLLSQKFINDSISYAIIIKNNITKEQIDDLELLQENIDLGTSVNRLQKDSKKNMNKYLIITKSNQNANYDFVKYYNINNAPY